MIRANKLEAYVEREESRRPITADVFLTDYCNAKCSYCRYAHASGDYMKFEEFVSYADRLIDLGVKGIILTGGGEPTINPHFNKIVGWLERSEIPYGINTNLIREVFCKPRFLKVSIDAGESARYKETRGVDKLDDVLAHVRDFCEYNKRNGRHTNVGVQCVALNKEDALSFYNAVKVLDVDYIYLRPYEGMESRITRSDVQEWFAGVNDERLNVSFKFDLKDYTAGWCVANWSVITVRHDGYVPYCCHRPNEVVGHILDRNILERKAAWHVDMRTCEKPCRLSGANKYLESKREERDICFV